MHIYIDIDIDIDIDYDAAVYVFVVCVLLMSPFVCPAYSDSFLWLSKWQDSKPCRKWKRR